MDRWPTPDALAAAPAGEAVRAWGRLGYPRRALRLHQAAVVITERFDGQVPADRDALLSLPGVGSYTAAAIASFAFGRRRDRAGHQRAPGAEPGGLRPGLPAADADRRARSPSPSGWPLAIPRSPRAGRSPRWSSGRWSAWPARPAATPARSATCAPGGPPVRPPGPGRRAAARRTRAPTGSAGAPCWPCCAPATGRSARRAGGRLARRGPAGAGAELPDRRRPGGR